MRARRRELEDKQELEEQGGEQGSSLLPETTFSLATCGLSRLSFSIDYSKYETKVKKAKRVPGLATTGFGRQQRKFFPRTTSRSRVADPSVRSVVRLTSSRLRVSLCVWFLEILWGS